MFFVGVWLLDRGSAGGVGDHGGRVARTHPAAGPPPWLAAVEEMVEVSLEAVGVELVQPVSAGGPVVLSDGLDEVVLGGHDWAPWFDSEERRSVGPGLGWTINRRRESFRSAGTTLANR